MVDDDDDYDRRSRLYDDRRSMIDNRSIGGDERSSMIDEDHTAKVIDIRRPIIDDH